MIIDLLQNIVNYSSLNTQITCTQVDKYTYDNTYIYVFDASNGEENDPTASNGTIGSIGSTGKMYEPQYSQSIIDKILIQKRFSKIKKFSCRNNKTIHNVNHMEYLEELDCSGSSCGLGQKGIAHLNKLKVIDFTDNYRIKNLCHISDTMEKVYSRGSFCFKLNGVWEEWIAAGSANISRIDK